MISLALLGGAIGLPIPEDIPILVTGALIQQRVGHPILLLVVCYISVLAGDILIYSVGRWIGPGLFIKRWFRSRVHPSRIKKIRSGLESRGFLMILFARHLFYLRTITFLTCGAVKMSPLRFLLLDGFAALLSLPLIASIGYGIMSRYGELSSDGYRSMRSVMELTGLALIVLVGGFLLIQRRQRLRED